MEDTRDESHTVFREQTPHFIYFWWTRNFVAPAYFQSEVWDLWYIISMWPLASFRPAFYSSFMQFHLTVDVPASFFMRTWYVVQPWRLMYILFLSLSFLTGNEPLCHYPCLTRLIWIIYSHSKCNLYVLSYKDVVRAFWVRHDLCLPGYTFTCPRAFWQSSIWIVFFKCHSLYS
jgi:hypothetical protein